jgi:hypothetical protein
MAQFNKTSLKSLISDFINRVAPFNGNPLIQKTEDNTIRDNVVDSMVAEIATTSSVAPLSASFNVDLAIVDEYSINIVTGAQPTVSFTLQNLNGNKVGKIRVTKSGSQIVSFANADINGELPQTGVTVLNFLVSIINGVYNVVPFRNGNAIFRDSAGVETRVQLLSKILEIGALDMTQVFGKTVNHGLTFSQIKKVSVLIINDSGTNSYDLSYSARGTTTPEVGGFFVVTSSSVIIFSNNNGLFQNDLFNGFDSILVNRGYITIEYIP